MVYAFAYHQANYLNLLLYMNYRKLMLSLALCLPLSALAKQILVQSPHLSLVLNADEGRQPEYVYFGSKLSGADLQTLQRPQGGRMNAYPAYGMDCPDPAAFACRHADGNLSTQLVVTGSDVKGNVTTIHLKDPVYNLFVDLKYRTYSDVDMIEAWTEITNKERHAAHPPRQCVDQPYQWSMGQRGQRHR